LRLCRQVGLSCGKRATNSAAVLVKGEILFRQTKMLLPTYDVFDEARYFMPAESQLLLTLNQSKVALTICEDAWNDKQFWERQLYRRDPVDELIAPAADYSSALTPRPITWESALCANRFSARPHCITTCRGLRESGGRQ